MQVSIISIGNSKGIRLSKATLEKYKIQDKVEMIFEEGFIAIKPISHPRAGWEEAFAEMHHNGDDKLLIPDVFEEEDWD